jgi:hypothetical protein
MVTDSDQSDCRQLCAGTVQRMHAKLAAAQGTHTDKDRTAQQAKLCNSMTIEACRHVRNVSLILLLWCQP